MKTRSQSFKRSQASTLLATALLVIIVAGVLASYLLLVENEYTQVARSQAWNKALMVSEAGVEEALAFINKYESTSTSLYDWSKPASAAEDGWTVNGNVYSKTNVVNPSAGYYAVYITNLNNAPAILSVGTAYWNFSPASPPPVRKIFVQTQFEPLQRGLLALTFINLNGNNIMVDSFDSRDPLHSDWQTNFTYQGTNYGYYPLSDPADKREAEAYVGSESNIVNVGNAEIYGYAVTGPGGTVEIKKNGSVGDTSWIGPDPSNPINNGIQPGHARDDMNENFTPLELTNVTWSPLNSIGSTNIGTNTYQYMITTPNSHYRIPNTLTANLYVAATNVDLYLPQGLSLSGNNGALTIGTNANVTIWSGDSISLSGGAAINNVKQIALALKIIGLAPGLDSAGDTVNGCTQISVGGNGMGTGSVFAPDASLSFNGGGSGTYNVVGSFIVHDIQLNGHYAFHFDKALLDDGATRGFIPVEWQEIVGQ